MTMLERGLKAYSIPEAATHRVQAVVNKSEHFSALSPDEQQIAIAAGTAFGLMPSEELVPFAHGTNHSFFSRIMERRISLREEGTGDKAVDAHAEESMRGLFASHVVYDYMRSVAKGVKETVTGPQETQRHEVVGELAAQVALTLHRG